MRKFKVGEEVTVRTWEDMEKQYGTKNFSPELPKDSFLGSILNELFSGKIILAPHRVVTDVMKPFCGRKMRISANPELNVYELEGAEPFKWSAEAFEEFWKDEEEPESTEVEEEKADMPKLENGMVVELRSGTRFLVAEFFGKQFLLSDKNWCHLDDMDFETGKSGFHPMLDIVKVIKPYCVSSLKFLKQSEHIILEAE
jgi:hypothetical protein|nr:MAG TPA: hypothetical protein [Caudoviricetes sp.]